ncbi:peptidase domain-containing ABC transporter [Duganella sp. HH105]|uniref:peptidase domain-containing ABC transporter n=1 Tax=Duganella sp. HH105 TaxID=1781067 RepID=UPI000877B2F0|nr:peptidase domain-containing ABC transporter [Duganella sp. HH105]OEZ60025.1 toxin RTX-I translocation ATP-binding protein [Duganella sp. HH105]
MSAAALDELTLRWRGGRRLPLLLQSEAAECGLACLGMVAGYHGHQLDLPKLRRRHGFSQRGASLKHLIDVASQLNLAPRPLRVELDGLPHLQLPCILHWELNHFVVLKKVRRSATGALRSIEIHDPARGARQLSAEAASASFTGIALELTPTPGFTPVRQRQSLSLRRLMGSLLGWRSALLKLSLLALALELFALASPFFMQLVVDDVLLVADRDLLTLLATGFTLLLLIQTALGVFRSWLVVHLSTQINLQWMANVFAHLMRLPMEFFERRHTGDVVSRFGAIQQIQQILGNAFVEAIIDGTLALLALLVMLAYSPWLCLVIGCALAAYFVLRTVMYRPLLAASEEQILLKAKEQTLFLESIRSMQAIKLFSQESGRQVRWQQALSAATERGLAVQKLNLGFSGAHTLLAGLENIAVIWLGARLAMDNTFSVGMLFAFISYKLTFTTRMYALIDKWQEMNMLSLYLERLADIVLSAPESQGAAAPLALPDSGGAPPAITLARVSFRYAEHEPWLLEEIDLTIAPGDSVALVGASGCGKTTLLKLMLGLLEPSTGQVLVDGVPLARLGPQAYRRLIGTVMQNDALLSGSIGDNISFFDADADPDWIAACAASAAVADEVARMPMRYATLIGDLGSNLSGGQRQRILLARALYKRPRILFLDEATSELDIDNERQVNRYINTLRLTRVIAAHRPETIRSAHRVIELAGGRIVADRRQHAASEVSPPTD